MRSDQSVLGAEDFGYFGEYFFQLVSSRIVIAVAVDVRKIGIGYLVCNKGGQDTVGIGQTDSVQFFIYTFQILFRLLFESDRGTTPTI